MTETEHDKDEPPAATAHATGTVDSDASAAKKAKGAETGDSKVDDFGLPVKEVQRPPEDDLKEEADGDGDEFVDAEEGRNTPRIQREEEIANEKHETPRAIAEDPHAAWKRGETPSSIQPPKSSADGQPSSSMNDKRDGEREEPETENIEPDQVSSPIRKPGKKSGKQVSEWSHQRLAGKEDSDEEGEEVEWQAMPALAEWDIYDDDGKLVAKGNPEEDAQQVAYADLGGAGKGYTKVQLDEDAQSATSMDDDTRYLFKDQSTNVVEEDEEQRDALSQLQATKDLLNEGQRIAYVGVARLAMYQMVKEMEDIEETKNSKKELRAAVEDMKKWVQQMMIRLYAHMEIISDGKHQWNSSPD